MDRQLELIKRNISSLYLEMQEEFRKVNKQLSAPPANLPHVIGDALAEQLSVLRNEVADTIGTRMDKERKVAETVLTVKLNEMVNRQVEMQVEFRMHDFEARLSGLRDALAKLQSSIENTIGEVVDSKMSCMLASMSASTSTAINEVTNRTAGATPQSTKTPLPAPVATAPVATAPVAAAPVAAAPVAVQIHTHMPVATPLETNTALPVSGGVLLMGSIDSGEGVRFGAPGNAEGGARITVKKTKSTSVKGGGEVP